jgi:hypothetical protein
VLHWCWHAAAYKPLIGADASHRRPARRLRSGMPKRRSGILTSPAEPWGPRPAPTRRSEHGQSAQHRRLCRVSPAERIVELRHVCGTWAWRIEGERRGMSAGDEMARRGWARPARRHARPLGRQQQQAASASSDDGGQRATRGCSDGQAHTPVSLRHRPRLAVNVLRPPNRAARRQATSRKLSALPTCESTGN